MTERPHQQKKLTEEEVEFLKTAFNLIDENQDGLIDLRELGRLLYRLNIKATENELSAMMAAQRDPDSKHPKDSLDFKGFVAMMERSKQQLPADFHDEARQLFAVMDRKNDGRVSKAQLRETLLLMNVSVSNAELDQMFDTADLNKDGYITYDEFAPMVTLLQNSPHPGAAAKNSSATQQQLKKQNKQPQDKTG